MSIKDHCCQKPAKFWSAATCRRLVVGSGRGRALRQSADKSAHSKLEVVGELEFVALEGINHLHSCRCACALEPRGGTPTVLIGQGHEFVSYGILMDVVEPCEIGAFKRQASIPKVVPNFTRGRVVQLVHLARGIGMKMRDEPS